MVISKGVFYEGTSGLEHFISPNSPFSPYIQQWTSEYMQHVSFRCDSLQFHFQRSFSEDSLSVNFNTKCTKRVSLLTLLLSYIGNLFNI